MSIKCLRSSFGSLKSNSVHGLLDEDDLEEDRIELANMSKSTGSGGVDVVFSGTLPFGISCCGYISYDQCYRYHYIQVIIMTAYSILIITYFIIIVTQQM